MGWRLTLLRLGFGYCLLSACFGPTMARSQGAPEPSLHIYGEAKVREPNSAGARLTATRPFTLAISGSNWWIATYESPQKIGQTNFHWEVLSITNGLLAQCYYSPNTRQLIATLKPLVAPVACPDQVSQFIWLMLTPSVRADAENKAILPPVYNPSADLGTNPDLRRNCEVEYLDQFRLWPKLIRFFSDGTYNSYSDGTNSTRRYPKPYDSGFLEARFETVAVTNWNEFTVPSRVIGEILAPGGRSPGGLRTNRLIEITVAGLQGLPPGFNLPPRPTSALAITDARAPVARNQMIDFRVDDGNWPTLEFSRAIVEKDKQTRLQLGLPPR